MSGDTYKGVTGADQSEIMILCFKILLNNLWRKYCNEEKVVLIVDNTLVGTCT